MTVGDEENNAPPWTVGTPSVRAGERDLWIDSRVRTHGYCRLFLQMMVMTRASSPVQVPSAHLMHPCEQGGPAAKAAKLFLGWMEGDDARTVDRSEKPGSEQCAGVFFRASHHVPYRNLGRRWASQGNKADEQCLRNLAMASSN